ncbi:hypothetical protein TNCV_2934231 [Trichonephila clavipes]|nr:hypothetical protein TNCV_2934231 [Trichonephila clavipes]
MLFCQKPFHCSDIPQEDERCFRLWDQLKPDPTIENPLEEYLTRIKKLWQMLEKSGPKVSYLKARIVEGDSKVSSKNSGKKKILTAKKSISAQEGLKRIPRQLII